LRKNLQVLFGDDRKSTLGSYFFYIGNFDPFSLWIGLILPHMLRLVLFSLPLKHVFVVFHKKIKKKNKNLGEDADFYSLF
jgi:hypothetical protein